MPTCCCTPLPTPCWGRPPWAISGRCFPTPIPLNQRPRFRRNAPRRPRRRAGPGLADRQPRLHRFRPAAQLLPHRQAIRERLAEILDLEIERIGLQAKTGEQVGPIGREEAIAAECVVLLENEPTSRNGRSRNDNDGKMAEQRQKMRMTKVECRTFGHRNWLNSAQLLPHRFAIAFCTFALSPSAA